MGMRDSLFGGRPGERKLHLRVQLEYGVFLLLQVFTACHTACPFGAVANVHAWERIGAAICFLARKLLKLAILRYVDDYFGPERCEQCAK